MHIQNSNKIAFFLSSLNNYLQFKNNTKMLEDIVDDNNGLELVLSDELGLISKSQKGFLMLYLSYNIKILNKNQ
jgi:hypothetical protein